MNIQETPLQFGYFLALLFAVLLWLRGRQTERLSDTLLGWILFFLAMEIQDYTFGFSGINVLWEELNGFPRYFPWVFTASIYFYLKAQINRDFRFKTTDIWHLMPYLVYFTINFLIFLQGADAVQAFQKSPAAWYLRHAEIALMLVSYLFYFSKSLKLYREYRAWTQNEFSDTDRVSFVWLRNFIYLIIAGEVFKWAWNIADIALGDLPYEQDWWWHLFTVAIIIYVATSGYAQPQPQQLRYVEQAVVGGFQLPEGSEEVSVGSFQLADGSEQVGSEQVSVSENLPKTAVIDPVLIKKITKAIEEDQVFLDPEISLSELAIRLKTNNSLLSAAINQHFGKNFNDFINYYRVVAFQTAVKSPKNQHLTLLAIALDCGFNSKATFNRAYKKATGNAPSER
jgi:AraC-like DNA-binding protein